jgi:hypothetical protein
MICMSHRFTAYLGCTGILALVTIAFPGIVIVGLFAGVVPGILLEAVPSLFFYSLPWWGTRALLMKAGALAGLAPASDVGRQALRAAAGVLAILLLAVPAILVPRTFNAPVEDTTTTLRAEDRETAGPLALSPVTAVLLRENYDWVKKKLYCETLCQRLLYNRAVSRIIVADGPNPRAVGAFWIERRDRCPEPAILDYDVRWLVDFPLQRGKTPEDRVRARIAAGECLLQGIGSLEEAGATISFRNVKEGVSIFSHPWTLQLDTAAANRLEIIDANGRVLYRRTEVTIEPLTIPLLIETRAGLLTTVTYAGWARSKMTYAPIGPHGRDVLPELLGAAARPPDEPEPH